MQIQHPAYTDAVQRGRPSTAPDGQSIDEDDGTFTVEDEERAIEVMETLGATYGVEFTDDGNVITDDETPPTAADATFDPESVDGIGATFAARIAESYDTVADLVTGTDDQQPEARLEETVEGVDRDVAGDVVSAALAAADDAGVSEATMNVIAADNSESGEE